MDMKSAKSLSKKLLKLIEPAAERIEVVGSVKRGDKLEVHDIEMLMIEKAGYPRLDNFVGGRVWTSHLEKTIWTLKDAGVLRDPYFNKANGPRQKRFAIVEAGVADFCLELFITTPAKWGIMNVIRTGPAEFSHCFVTPQGVATSDGNWGLLPKEYEYIKGETAIRRNGEILDLPGEDDAIGILGRGWIEPENRRRLVVPRKTG